MKVCLLKKSFFTFRGIESYDLDLLGKTVYEHMKELLRAEDMEYDCERVVLYPVYPFLTRERLFSYLDEREGSYCFPGGYVIRSGCPLSESPRKSALPFGRGLFSLADFPSMIARAAQESASYHAGKGALIEEGAEVSFLAEISEGAIVRKGAKIVGKCVIGRNAEIGAGSEIVESEIGADTVVKNSVAIGVKVGERCSVGPNAYLRPGSVIQDDCRIGDFVEIKNAKVGRGTKIAHLTYVGDAELGSQVNVGCGVVFVNYDGKKKTKTIVGDRCFIGSNCNLIAPLTVGDGAFLAAGTTLTHDLGANDFCIGRCRESVKPDRAERYYSPDRCSRISFQRKEIP